MKLITIFLSASFLSLALHLSSRADWTSIGDSQLGVIYKVKFISSMNGWILNRDGSPSLSGLLHTTDGGNSWTRIRDHSSGVLSYFDFLDDSLGYVAGSGRFFWTRNGGRTWVEISGGQGGKYNKIFDTELAYVGVGSRLYKSIDSLRSWQFLSQVPCYGLFCQGHRFVFVSPDTIVACGGSDSPLIGDWIGTIECNRSVDAGRTWQLTYFDTMSYCKAVAFADKQVGYAFTTLAQNLGGHLVTLKTTNAGASWLSIPARISLPYFQIDDAFFQNANVGFACGDHFDSNTGLARTSDGGITWNPVLGVERAMLTMSWPDSVHGWVAGTGGRIYRTTNGGGLPIQLASFTARHLGDTRVRLDWRTLSETNNLGFYVQRRRQTDSTFTEISSLIPGYGTTNEPHDYSFTDSNATINRWYYRLKQVDLAGPVHFTEPIIVDVTTGVADEKVPTRFALEQNYPNPFNPTTTIRFEIAEPGFVELKVFDLLGREVATLANEVRDAGSYDEVLDASLLASGVYIYKLRSGNFTDVKRMVLLK